MKNGQNEFEEREEERKRRKKKGGEEEEEEKKKRRRRREGKNTQRVSLIDDRLDFPLLRRSPCSTGSSIRSTRSSRGSGCTGSLLLLGLLLFNLAGFFTNFLCDFNTCGTSIRFQIERAISISGFDSCGRRLSLPAFDGRSSDVGLGGNAGSPTTLAREARKVPVTLLLTVTTCQARVFGKFTQIRFGRFT